MVIKVKIKCKYSAQGHNKANLMRENETLAFPCASEGIIRPNDSGVILLVIPFFDNPDKNL